MHKQSHGERESSHASDAVESGENGICRLPFSAGTYGRHIDYHGTCRNGSTIPHLRRGRGCILYAEERIGLNKEGGGGGSFLTTNNPGEWGCTCTYPNRHPCSSFRPQKHPSGEHPRPDRAIVRYSVPRFDFTFFMLYGRHLSLTSGSYVSVVLYFGRKETSVKRSPQCRLECNMETELHVEACPNHQKTPTFPLVGTVFQVTRM